MPGMANAETARVLAPTARRGRPRADRAGPTKTPGVASTYALVGAWPKDIDLTKLEFTGCEAVPMTLEQYHEFEGRLEVWDRELKTAWMVREGPMPAHEGPGQSLGMLVARIAAVRGSPIKCYGTMVLMVEGPDGEPMRLMQADQTLYIDPEKTHLIGARAMLVGSHNFPDVVLEVDNTTDVRRGKLKIYEAWGFPELWVDVPDARPASRPKSRVSELTIYLLEDGVYQPAPESRAFPGWRVEDIHLALNEIVPSLRTNRILERLGRELGARDGTGPDDDPLMRSLRKESEERGRLKGRAEGQRLGRVEGRAEGQAAGRAEGRAKGQAEAVARMVARMLRSRGIETPAAFPANVQGFAKASETDLVEAALACDDEADFRARVAMLGKV